jgi:hypothetical protein
MVRLTNLIPSHNPEKKYDAVLETDEGRKKVVSFGSKGMDDFTLTKDENQKKRYLARHKIRENWSDPKTPGFWSRWYLWNKPSKNEALRDLRERFNI